MSDLNAINKEQEELNLGLDNDSVAKFFAKNSNLKFRKVNSFIRDVSFESKNILTTPTSQETNNTQLKLNLEVASGKLQNPSKELTDIYEVILKINAEVFFKNNDSDVVLLNLEIEYVYSVYLNPNIIAEKVEHTLYVDTANEMLAEAKEIISQITKYSCWKSIVLDDVKIDLEKMFLEHKTINAASTAN